MFLCFKKKLETVDIVFLSAITSCYNCCKKPVAAAGKSCRFGFCGIAEIYWSGLCHNFRQQFCGFGFWISTYKTHHGLFDGWMVHESAGRSVRFVLKFVEGNTWQAGPRPIDVVTTLCCMTWWWVIIASGWLKSRHRFLFFFGFDSSGGGCSYYGSDESE